MRSALRLWLVLTGVLVPATLGVSLGLFRHVDLTYEAHVQLVAVPLLQTVLVLWWLQGSPASWLAGLARRLWRHSLARVVLLMDLALLAAGWVWRDASHVGLASASSLHPAWIGSKAMLAAMLLIWMAMVRTAGRGDGGIGGRGDPRAASLTPGARVSIAALGVLTAAIAIHPFAPWLGRMPPALMPSSPRVLQWLTFYGTLLLVFLWLVLAAGKRLRAFDPLAERAFELSAAGLVAVAVIVEINVFMHPFVNEPWRSLALTSASMAAGMLLAGSLCAAFPEPVAVGPASSRRRSKGRRR